MSSNEHKVGKSHSSLQELQQSLKKESCSEQEYNAEYDTCHCILSPLSQEIRATGHVIQNVSVVFP